MEAALVFTGSGPILVLTTFESLQAPDFLERLAARGISKFIAHTVPLELVKKRYGARFSAIMGDLSQKDDLRVLDIDGHHIFKNFSFEEMGSPLYSPPLQEPAREAVMEASFDSEWLWARIDEYGKLVDSSYPPMLGSRVIPSIPMGTGVSPKQARFKIDGQGIIFDGTPQKLNGHKLVLPARSSPALGRSSDVPPTCTWRSDNEGGWT